MQSFHEQTATDEVYTKVISPTICCCYLSSWWLNKEVANLMSFLTEDSGMLLVYTEYVLGSNLCTFFIFVSLLYMKLGNYMQENRAICSYS